MKWIKLRRLRHELAEAKAENDRVFSYALDQAPKVLRGKARLRWALEVLKVGDDYAREKALRRQIDVLSGKLVPNGDGTYTVVL